MGHPVNFYGDVALNTGDYLSIPDSDDWYMSGDATFEFWFRQAILADGNFQFILSQREAAPFLTSAFHFYIDNSQKFNAAMAGDGGLVIPATLSAVSLNTWYHIAFTIKSQTLRLYLNGFLQNTPEPFGQALHNVNAPLIIGKNPLSDTGYFTGFLDELRISKGICRYATTAAVGEQEFVPPVQQFDTDAFGFPTVSDPETKLLLHFNNDAFFDYSQQAHSVTNFGVTFSTNNVFGGYSASFGVPPRVGVPINFYSSNNDSFDVIPGVDGHTQFLLQADPIDQGHNFTDLANGIPILAVGANTTTDRAYSENFSVGTTTAFFQALGLAGKCIPGTGGFPDYLRVDGVNQGNNHFSFSNFYIDGFVRISSIFGSSANISCSVLQCQSTNPTGFQNDFFFSRVGTASDWTMRARVTRGSHQNDAIVTIPASNFSFDTWYQFGFLRENNIHSFYFNSVFIGTGATIGGDIGLDDYIQLGFSQKNGMTCDTTRYDDLFFFTNIRISDIARTPRPINFYSLP